MSRGNGVGRGGCLGIEQVEIDQHQGRSWRRTLATRAAGTLGMS